MTGTGKIARRRGIRNQITARLKQGQTIPQVIVWAQKGLAGFVR
jgi:hypothetical protein